jgi:hypothetical protein
LVQPSTFSKHLKGANSLFYLILLLKILLLKSTNMRLLFTVPTYLLTFKHYQTLEALHPLFQPSSLKLSQKTYQQVYTTPKVLIKNLNVSFKLYFLYLRFSFKNIVFFFKPHTHFRLFFNFLSRDSIISLNTLRFFNR